MRRRLLGVPVLVAMVLSSSVVGCTPKRSVTVNTDGIDGFRTDPDHKGLVASYTGGICDGPARLVLTESEARIEAKVRVEQDGGPGGCPAIGVPRTVATRLADQIGKRTVWSGGREYVPFDGAHLLTSSAWPAGFDGVREIANYGPAPSSPEAPIVTRSWNTTRFQTATSSANDECAATRGNLNIRIGPDPRQSSSDRVKIGTAKVGTATAKVYRDGTADEPVAWVYVWQVDHRRVELSNTMDCNKADRLLSRAELQRVAESLRPA